MEAHLNKAMCKYSHTSNNLISEYICRNDKGGLWQLGHVNLYYYIFVVGLGQKTPPSQDGTLD